MEYIYPFILGYAVSDFWHILTHYWINLEGKQQQFGYHFHHSMFGYIALATAAVFYMQGNDVAQSFLLFGLGIIVQHRIRERKFVIIEKVSTWKTRPQSKKYW